MTATEIRAAFNEVIEKAAAAGYDVSRIEIAREYFSNPSFRENLQAFLWAARK